MDDPISRIEAALEAGPTPGPWESLPVGHGPHYVARVNNREVVPPDACELAHEIVDARYIAAASPDRIARLLDEIERLRAENAEWREKAATWLASPEAAQRLAGYREIAARTGAALGAAGVEMA